MFNFFDKTFGKWTKPTSDRGLPVHLAGTSLILPIDQQARAIGSIVTHNAASIPANTASVPASWIDTQDEKNPFTEFEVVLTNDAATSSSVHLYWSNDGVAIHAQNWNVLPASTERYRANDADRSFKTKAKWLKVVPENKDTAAAHTMTVTILTKA